MNIQNIELNDQFKKALEVMENTSRNVFVTGKAGTGKSTLLAYFRHSSQKKVVILAPTGVAALNVQGQTLHSFFRFKPDITFDKVKKLSSKNSSKNIYKKIDTIVIDEVSMVRADLLDCVDRFLRLNGKSKTLPFGGVQMIFIGDLYQLPPVVTGKESEIFKLHYKSPYFFDARIFEVFSMEFIELEKVYRQKDQQFIDLLNAIRNNSVTEEHLNLINQRLDPEFENKHEDFFIHLTTTNQMAEEINQKELEKIKGPLYSFYGEKQGDFESKYLPTKIDLSLKIGAQVMMLNNDSVGRWVNGNVGEVIDIDKENIVSVELTGGNVVEVSPYTWQLYQFSYDEISEELTSHPIGSFIQYPLMLAWAVTIHKSQGKTFERVIIDMGKGAFAHGQTYVALSRCTSLAGIVLKKPLQKRHIFMDWRVVKFVTEYQYQISEKNMPSQGKVDMIREAIENNKQLEIIYLKTNDEKSKRVVVPSFVGELMYLGKKYLGLVAHDLKRQAKRTFRIDRILEIAAL